MFKNISGNDRIPFNLEKFLLPYLCTTQMCNCNNPPPPQQEEDCPVPYSLGWMRSSEYYGFVPGARIPIQAPAGGIFNGWNYGWVRGSTPIQHFENDEIYENAVLGTYTDEVFGTSEVLFNATDRNIGYPFVWDGGTSNQYFNGYYSGIINGGYATWANVEIASDFLYSPETRINTPGVYTPYHYSLRRFTSYLNVDLSCYNLNSVYLASQFQDGNGNYVFPLNDSIFVFVNGVLAYWASNDVIGSGNIAQNRLYFNNIRGIILNREFSTTPPPPTAEFLFTDGWYLALGGAQKIADISPYLRHGKNVIDVICDDYYFGGGMSRFDFIFNTTLK